MAFTGIQKAAMLLMSLDASSASELLKGVDAAVLKELAEELVCLDAAGFRGSRQTTEVARQFCGSLQADSEFRIEGFLMEVLKSSVGDEQAEHIQRRIQNFLCKTDLLTSVRCAESEKLASVLEQKQPETMTVYDKAAIAEMVWKRFGSIEGDGTAEDLPAPAKQSSRKVAVVLRNLSREIRDGLLGEIRDTDSRAGETVAELMVLWEDIPLITESSLAASLKTVDAAKLARAMYDADEAIVEKIRSNISEQAAAAVDEEVSLMETPQKEDIEEARRDIVRVLREMNDRGELVFVEQWDA